MKLRRGYIVVNLLAMLAVIVLLCLAVNYGLALYTHHGESIEVPQVKGMNIDQARELLDDLGLEVVIADSGYIKSLPVGQVLEQSPLRGFLVKSGHSIFLTVNSGAAKSLQLPDIIDNSSHREAEAQLAAMGFKVGEAIYVHGEKDWVYGIVVNGKNVYTGDYVPSDAKVCLQVGDGLLNESLDRVVVDDSQSSRISDDEDDFEDLFADEEAE